MAQPSLPCPNWVWSTQSNVHVAKDRQWFGDDYTPFDSAIETHLGPGPRVVGVGTVCLPTQRLPPGHGNGSPGTIRLETVLHVPDAICNIIGYPIDEAYRIKAGIREESKGTIEDGNGQQVAYFKRNGRFFEVQLSEPPVGPVCGPSGFSDKCLYVINANWPDSERKRWEAHSQGQQAGQAPDDSKLSAAEKEWLKENWGREFKFLAVHGLSIYDEDDRDEGRRMLRAMMMADSDPMEEDDDEDEAESDDSIVNGDHPERYLADSYFTAEELVWIKKAYGDSINFMFSFGLKFYNLEDGKEAQVIARAMMNDKEERDEDDDI